MRNSFVIIFEDNPDALKTAIELLQREGHRNIGTAGSIEDLRINLPGWTTSIRPDQPVIALIDNQAPWNDGEEPDPRGVGSIAERMIKEAIGHVTTVATTIDDNVGYGDVRYDPRNRDVNVGKFVTQLPAKER